MTWVLALCAVTLGAALQRVTGLGFTLVSGPLLVLVLNPFDGIVLANILSFLIAAIVLIPTFRHAQWKTAAKLSIGIVVSVPLGALIVYALDADMLLILVGALTTIAVVLALTRRPMPVFRGTGGAIFAGSLSGFSNVTAGVGGPALAMFGAATRMPMSAFVPTVQVVALLTNALSIAAKPNMSLPLPLVIAAVCCVLLGLVVGSSLQRVIAPSRAQTLALALALLGSLAATARGVFALVV
ncbi:sulfite exporter TauE/SafE family protein [Microbacterium sp. MPKO10]|uniref:sulfite exporter TauE/SafE family protein n=1 Tax=Microbacterium sp. MPKO10 TaxID=2989818 RepID=UPI002235F5DC|nr:sulfite exporter TauE/SafE family protein [Microbacterium sp. MPKO10]MCW4459833.1 sulfite exporter TauE/SafE family protein [Microbacterium sp. MPKO10]